MITRLRLPRARPAARKVPARGTRSYMWERFRGNRLALIGSAIVLAEVVLAVVGPFVAPYDPIAQQTAIRLQPPSSAHWLGTDDLGRDVLSRIMHGAGLSLGAGIAVVLFGIVTGIPLGAIAAYFRRTDALIMRACEIMLAVPGILLALVLVATRDPDSSAFFWGGGLQHAIGDPAHASLVLALRENDFVIAARAVGCQEGRILARHILPNNDLATRGLANVPHRRRHPYRLVAQFPWSRGSAARPRGGRQLSNGRHFLYNAPPHVAAFPGSRSRSPVLAFNLVGTVLRDVLDPRFVSRGEEAEGSRTS